MELDLRGKRVLITGASTGIGAALALAFAGQGCHVGIHYGSNVAAATEVADQVRVKGVDCELFAADLSEPNAGQNVVNAAVDRLGGLDILINNAGGILVRRSLAEISADEYQEIVAINQTAVFDASRAVIGHFTSKKKGVILNTTSIAARNGGGTGTVVYAMTKAAVSTLTRGLAKELAPWGIRVNSIAPGVTDTPFHTGRTSPEEMLRQASTIPLGRVGTPADCVGAALFLASDRAAGYITGQSIEVNGGALMP